MSTSIRRVLSFRLATLNVHFFQDGKQQVNVHRLATVLEPLKLDLLAVQEALHTDQPDGVGKGNRHYLKRLASLLNFPHLSFCNIAHDFGNGLLSKFPISRSDCLRTETIAGHNRRGMLTAVIDHSFFQENRAVLCVTHLDQIDEQVRLAQMQSLEKQSTSDDQLRLMVGDFNALTFEDYSEDYFREKIQDVRRNNGWEPPFDLLTNMLKERGYEDCWRSMNPAKINEQAITCAYQTRIDYIWKRGVLKQGWMIEECRIFPTDNATDHHGVLITFSKVLPASMIH